MLALKKILKQSKVARFMNYVFICNFFTCQCLAMMPTKVLVGNFKSGIKSLFSTYNEAQDSLELSLMHEPRSNIYNLEIIKHNEYGDTARRNLSSITIHDGCTGEDTLDFGYGFVFSIANGALRWGELLNGFSGCFRTNSDVLISDVHFDKSLSIEANTIRIQNEFVADNALTLTCRKLLNDGIIFSPSLNVNAKYLKNVGSILGSRINISSYVLTCLEKSLISSSEAIDITSRESFESNTASICGKNLRIRSNKADIANGSFISCQENFNFSGTAFFIDKNSTLHSGKNANMMTSFFHNKEGKISIDGTLDVFAGVFFNEGMIEAQRTDVLCSKENAAFGPISYNKFIDVFDYLSPNRYLGSFANVGEVNSDVISILSERYLLNRGILRTNIHLDLTGELGLANSGYIVQTGLTKSSYSSISSQGRIANKNGVIELAGCSSITGESFDNTHGSLKAKQLKIRLAMDAEDKFRKNEKEHINLQNETNHYSEGVQAYLRINRSIEKAKADSSDTDTSFQKAGESREKKGDGEQSKKLLPEIGHLVNTGGIIEVLRDLDVAGSGAIYNAEQGQITAKDRISLNVYGRVLNQLGSKISANSVTVQSCGRVFNTAGSVIEGLLSFTCDGWKNGIGSRIVGGLSVNSHTSICNMGTIISTKTPLQMTSDFFIKNCGTVIAKSVLFTSRVRTSPASAISLSSLINSDIDAQEVQLLLPNATLENQNDTTLTFKTIISAREFRNLALLKSQKQLKIFTKHRLVNAVSDNVLNASATKPEMSSFPLLNDYDIRRNEILSKLLATNEIDFVPHTFRNNAMIVSDGDLKLRSNGEIKNTGMIQTSGKLMLKAKQLQHGWAHESVHHESLPELEFDYDFMEAQPSYIRAGGGASIEVDKFLNTFGSIDVVGNLVSSNSVVFLNYAGDINVRGEVQITTPVFSNLVGTVKTNRADKRYWSLEFCNTTQAIFNVLDGALRINSPYAINSGSFLYGQGGVFLNGHQTNDLISVFDITSHGFEYTRMFSVNEYNKGQYTDKILGIGYASTGLGAIIRAELNETVRKKIIPASVSGSQKIVIDGYKNLKSDGIIHGAFIGIKTGDGVTELGYTGDAILPAISDCAKKIEVYRYISALAHEGQFELGNDSDDFLFKSRSNGKRIAFTIIGDPGADFSKLKLPFSLEILEVMLLRQMQKSLGAGYLADMPTLSDAAKIAHDLASHRRDTSNFPFLKDYTDNEISVISEEEAKFGLFFKPQKIGDYEVLMPELRLSSESVNTALLNPAGSTVAQGSTDSNIIIDTDGFLHATASLHADDSIKIKAARGALFETTTYEAMSITQNVTLTTSRSGPFGINSSTEYHKLSEWHRIKRAREPMLATTTRGDFIIVLPDDEETAEFKGMFADIAGNFEVYRGNCILSPLEIATVVECPRLSQIGANRISTLLPVFMKTVIESKRDFLTDVRVFKNTGSKIEAMGDVVINATDRIEFNTEARKFTLAEGMEVNEGTFTTKVSSRKVDDVIFNQPEVNAGCNIKFSSESVYLTGLYESKKDIEIKAKLATLESVLGYGTDDFRSKASNMFSTSRYSRFATFARVAPTVLRSHRDFILDILDVYSEHSIQKLCRNERITAGDIDASPLKATEIVIEHSSSSGFNFFLPTSVVAPICDGNINSALEAFWRESSLLSATHSLLHSKKGVEIAASGISTALSAYSSIKTVLGFGIGGAASLFGIGNFGFYHNESVKNTTHEFTIGSATLASGSIEWRARNGNIRIAHRIAEAGGNQTYIAAGKILVDAGNDSAHAISKTISFGGNFNIFTMDMAAYASQGETHSEHVEYQPSLFKSCGDNVFRAGESIEIVIPQIEGTRNVFDAILVSLENRANEQKVHSSTHGVTISTNSLEAAALTAGANIGTSSSHHTFLNDAYIRGATDFMHSHVKNQGCLVMNIENAGASYQYVPASEVNDSSSFAIGLSGLDLTSVDAFAYSLGRGLASSAASAGVGLAASKAGLGGFISSIAASLAGAYINSEVIPQPRDAMHKPVGLGSNGNVSYDRDGNGFNAVGIEFDRAEFNVIINRVKEHIFNEALDKGASTEATVRKVQKAVKQISEEKAKVDVTAEQVDETESNLKAEIISAIGDAEVQKLAEGKNVSNASKVEVVRALSKSIKKLERQKAELNLHAPINQNEVQAASLQSQNELIDEKILLYSTFCDALSQSNSGMTRSSSLDDLLQDTFIRQGQMAFGTVGAAFSSLAHEANSMSRHDYVELQRSRLPAEARDNPEVLAKLGMGYVFYKGVAKLGDGLSALDDITCNVVSGAMRKFGEGCEWLGTHTRRLLRDDLGLSQRLAQNAGDVVQLIAEFFAPGAVAKGISSASKIVGAAKFKNKLLVNYGLVWDSWVSHPKQIINGTSYAKIGKRLYTEHAIGRMLPSGLGRNANVTKEGMSVSPNIVEHVIRHGQKTEIVMPNGTQRIKYSSGTVEVCTENNGKLIVTVNSLRGKQ